MGSALETALILARRCDSYMRGLHCAGRSQNLPRRITEKLREWRCKHERASNSSCESSGTRPLKQISDALAVFYCYLRAHAGRRVSALLASRLTSLGC